MLKETKKDLTFQARKLIKPYEDYSIDELADAYCTAVDSGDESLKNIYMIFTIVLYIIINILLNVVYRARSLAGQGVGLLIRRSRVQIPAGPLYYYF